MTDIDFTQIDPSAPLNEQERQASASPATTRPQTPGAARPGKLYAPAQSITIHDLVLRLLNLGVKVSNSENYLALYAHATTAERPTSLNLLEATVDQWQAEALAAGAHSAAVHHAQNEYQRLLAELDEAMRASMAEEADTYLDRLRPQFDRAADLARTLHAAGIDKPLAKPAPKEITTRIQGEAPHREVIPTPEDLDFVRDTYGDAAAAAWVEFIDDNEVGTLESAATLRATLAEVLGVGEGHSGHSVGVDLQGRPGFFDLPVYRKPRYLIWLILAPDLALRPFKDTEAS